MGSSTTLNPNAREYYPRGYVSSLQPPPISTTFHPYNPIRFLHPPPPPPLPLLHPPSSFIHHLSHSSPPPPPPPPPSPPPVMHMHDQAHLPRRDMWSARRWWLGRGRRQGGQGSRGGFLRQLRRGCDTGTRDSERIVSEEMRKMRIVEQRDVSRRRIKPVVPVKCDANITTVMIRNIPNKYTRDLLMEFLDDHCKVENEKEESESDSNRIVSAYDFVYLPLDFRRKANLGYAFVNFTDPRAVWRFHTSKNNQYWEFFSSNKIREVATAKLQGKEQLIKRFENTLFACESDEFLPVVFSPPRDGTNNKSVTQRTVGMHR